MKRLLIITCLVLVSLCSFAGKKPTAVWYLLDLAQDSTMSDENLSISITTKVILPAAYQAEDKTPYSVWIIKLENKSNDMVFIDLAQCFQIFNRMSVSMYAPSAAVASNTQATTVGLGVWGRFGGSVTSMVSGTTSQSYISFSQQIIAIPPHCIYFMPDYNVLPKEHSRLFFDFVKYKKVGMGKYAGMGIMPACINAKRGEVIEYDYDSTPLELGLLFRYSFDSNMTNAKSINCNFYIAYEIGTAYSTSPFNLMQEYEIAEETMPGSIGWDTIDGHGLIRMWDM